MRSLLRRVRYVLRWRRQDAELAEEIEFHRAMLARELAGGASAPEDARAAAQRRLGNHRAAREWARDEWIGTWLQNLVDDVRIAARTLRRSPAFAVSAGSVLAIAIGATTAMFAAFNHVLLQPLSIADPERVLVAWERRNEPVHEVSYRDFVDWRGQNHTFDTMAAMGSVTWSQVLEQRAGWSRIETAAVSWSFFEVLGTMPALGRTFRPHDDRRDAARVVVLGHRLWTQTFGGDVAIVGSVIRFDNQPFTVIGVMSRGFEYPAGAEAWTPLVPALAQEARPRFDPLEERTVGVLYVIGRLRADRSREQAMAELDVIAGRLAHADDAGVPRQVVLTPILDHMFGRTRTALWLLMVLVAVVFLIACANVTALLLSRNTIRRRETALRLALGGGRRRLFQEALAQMTLIVGAAALGGLVLARGGVDVMTALAPGVLGRFGDLGVTWPAVLFCAGISCVAAFACAVTATGPADVPAAAVLRGIAMGDTAAVRRTRRVLIAVQVAIATALVAGAGLLVRSVINLRDLQLGFEPQGMLTLDVEPLEDSKVSYDALYHAILKRVAAVPGVEAVGAVYLRPLAYGAIGLDSGFLLEGQQIDRPDTWRANPSLNYEAVAGDYFGAMRIALRAGRLFSDADTEDAPGVVIVSESTARRLWPGQNAIGRRLSVASAVTTAGEFPWQTVVGVVEDVRYRGLDDVRFDIYMPTAQTQHRVKHLVVRTSVEPLSAAAAVVAAVRETTRRVVVEHVSSMSRIVGDAMAPWTFTMSVAVFLAVVAVTLACVGLIGLVTYSIAQRTREIAVRVAIGAQPRALVLHIALEAIRVAGCGALLGLAASIALVQLARSLLFHVSPYDLPTFGAVVALLVCVSVGASVLAAVRVTAIDPAMVLRGE